MVQETARIAHDCHAGTLTMHSPTALAKRENCKSNDLSTNRWKSTEHSSRGVSQSKARGRVLLGNKLFTLLLLLLHTPVCALL